MRGGEALGSFVVAQIQEGTAHASNSPILWVAYDSHATWPESGMEAGLREDMFPGGPRRTFTERHVLVRGSQHLACEKRQHRCGLWIRDLRPSGGKQATIPAFCFIARA